MRTPTVLPHVEAVRRAVTAALRAPSVHNTQPWRWRIAADRIELFADRDRGLPATDPDGRDLVVSCGIALGHLHAALAAAGTGHTIERFPDDDRDHLATIRFTGTAPDRETRSSAVLAASIGLRRSDRRPFTDGALPAPTRAALGLRAARHGVALLTVPGTDLLRLVALEAEAARAAHARPGQEAELQAWTRRYAGARDGIPPASIPTQRRHPVEPELGVRFPAGSLPEPPITPDQATVVALVTPVDDDPARLAAGEAASAVLLTATRAGLASCPLSRVLECRETRAALAARVLRTTAAPQLLIRLGRPIDDVVLPATPRRRLADVLTHDV